MNDRERPKCVINSAAYDREGRRTDIDLEAISDVLAVDDGSFVWLGLYEPDEDILEQVQEEFGLHDLAVEDAHKAHQRPKVEAYGNSLFIALHTAQIVDNNVRFGETHVFIGPRYLVTVRHGASTSYAAARIRVEREPELLRHGPSAGLYAVLDTVVDNFMPIVDEFSHELNDLEQKVFAEDFHKSTVQRLYELKRDLMRLRMAASPLQDILGQLARTRGELIGEEMRLYFRDVHDHTLRIDQATNTLSEMLTAAMTVNLSLVTVRQGEVVKRLGAWAALLAAPTLIASWYGMNFAHMPELGGRYSYAVLVGAMAAVCVGLYAMFKRAKWL